MDQDRDIQLGTNIPKTAKEQELQGCIHMRNIECLGKSSTHTLFANLNYSELDT